MHLYSFNHAHDLVKLLKQDIYNFFYDGMQEYRRHRKEHPYLFVELKVYFGVIFVNNMDVGVKEVKSYK